MPVTEFHESPAALRGETTTAGVHDGREQDLESFQKTVTDRFVELSLVSSDDLLSLTWTRQLLNSFQCCLDEFRAILFNNRSVINKSPLDRFVNDFFERSVKALDVCNAIRDGIEHVREWKKFLGIVLCALDVNNSRLISSDRSNERLESAGQIEETRPKINNRLICEGQFRRAKKALIELSISMLDEKDSSSSVVSQRNRSFGRQKDHHSRSSVGPFRSMSWSVSRSWSAARQIQAIGNNLVVPRGNEVMASNGVVLAVYTMNCVLLFVMWCLVAAIPCQDRGLQVHFSIPRQFGWASAVLGLHERILEESRKRERRNARGLLREIGMVDKFTRMMNELVDSVQFPLTEEKERELRERVEELRHICERINEGLDPLERQVREVFCKIVHTRTEGLNSWGRSNHQN